MTKVKQNPRPVDRTSTTHLKSVKNNPIQKKKNNKFANTSSGKIHLINGKNLENNGKPNQSTNKQKQVEKDSPDSPDTSPKVIVKKNSYKQLSYKPPAHIPTIKKKDKNNVSDESDESLEDINEGIVLAEESVISQDSDNEVDEEETDNDIVPNIFGESLAEDTDEDDRDFNEDEVDDEDDDDDDDSDNQATISQLKGVKMFKGLLKQKFEENNDEAESEDEDEDDDDDDDDDDENNDGNDKDENIEEDDDDDEDEDEDEDEDMDDSNISTGASMSLGKNKKKRLNVSLTEDVDEDYTDSDEDEDDDDDDDDEEEESTPGLKDLLGSSLVDDENDEDFEGDDDEDDEDIDISDEESDIDTGVSEEERRTIFVGNIPKATEKSEIKKIFREFGPIKSIRLRGLAPQNEKLSKKVTAIKKLIHPNADTFNMFIVYKNEESIPKALSMHGKIFNGYYLRVDTVDAKKQKQFNRKAVFLGNLPFKINDNDVWKHFNQCGQIDYVRIIRDKTTRVGKGIGYVNFKSEDSIPLALELNGSTLLNREIRVKRYNETLPSRKESTNKKTKRSLPMENKAKKFKVNDVKTTPPVKSGKRNLKVKGKSQENSSPNSDKKKAATFQGQKANAEKKAKKTKLDKKKKKIAAILTAKSKRVQKV